jgi:L-threonylcarbamoyladenylate synthase
MTKSIKIAWDKSDAISASCSILRKGGIIVYPTDTIYGIGCDAKNKHAIEKINLIKGRQTPMSVITSSKSVIKTWLDIEERYQNLILKKITSSDTFIVPVKDNIVSNLILGKDNSLGIRIPNHKFCNKLSLNYPNPIITTSVNRTGKNPLTRPDLINIEFKNEIDLIIDDGVLDNKGSKIFKFDNKEFICLRS